MSDVAEIEIPIRIECELTDGWGGERWDVKNIKDGRTNTKIGNIGVYDFDANCDFPRNFDERGDGKPERIRLLRAEKVILQRYGKHL